MLICLVIALNDQVKHILVGELMNILLKYLGKELLFKLPEKVLGPGELLVDKIMVTSNIQ